MSGMNGAMTLTIATGGKMSKHTPGPWHVAGQDICIPEWGSEHEHGRVKIAEVKKTQYTAKRDVPIKAWPANAARIVECVNACEGIENPKEILDLIKVCQLIAEDNDGAGKLMRKSLKALGIK